MNFTMLMLHGMSAIAVFSDVVIGRIILLLTALTGIIGASIIGVLYVRLFTDFFIMGFATNVILALAMILINASFIGFVIIMALLNSRNLRSAMPDDLLDNLAELPAEKV